MNLGLFQAPRTVSVLAVAGFSILVAGLDFAKRRARTRPLPDEWATWVSRANRSKTAAPFKPGIVIMPATAPAESQSAASVEEPAQILNRNRNSAVVPTLPFGGMVPMPRPTPRLPDSKSLSSSVLWWQET